MGRPHSPTEEEILAVLADARASDPAGYSYDEFYYTGYRDENEDDFVVPRSTVTPPFEDFSAGDIALYFHPKCNVWRAFPPSGVAAITDLPTERADSEASQTQSRRRDMLKGLGIRVIKRVRRSLGENDGGRVGKGSRIIRIKRRLTRRKD